MLNDIINGKVLLEEQEKISDIFADLPPINNFGDGPTKIEMDTNTSWGDKIGVKSSILCLDSYKEGRSEISVLGSDGTTFLSIENVPRNMGSIPTVVTEDQSTIGLDMYNIDKPYTDATLVDSLALNNDFTQAVKSVDSPSLADQSLGLLSPTSATSTTWSDGFSFHSDDLDLTTDEASGSGFDSSSNVKEIKAELRNKIQTRRLSEGKQLLTIQFEEKTYKLTAEEERKVQRQKERNRASANKSRLKRKAIEEELEQKVTEYERNNCKLRRELEALKRYKQTLQQHYTRHMKVCPRPRFHGNRSREEEIARLKAYLQSPFT